MRTIFLQGWEDIEYKGKNPRFFHHWSNLVEGVGDERLGSSRSAMVGSFNWFRKHLLWKKYIILAPKAGRRDVNFRMGFYSKQFNICKISGAVRNVSDGPFAMRMGPENCHFFVVGTGEIELSIAGYIRKDLDLY